MKTQNIFEITTSNSEQEGTNRPKLGKQGQTRMNKMGPGSQMGSYDVRNK
jgi:hypothetical protein